MARDRKFLCEFQSDNATFYKVEVYNNDSSDSTEHTPNLGSDGFSLTYQTDTDNRFTGLIPSEVKFDILLENDTQRSVITNIQNTPYGTFDIGIYKSTDDSTYNLYWAGVILNDVSSLKDVDYPQRVTLTAICGLAALKDKPFNENVAYTTPSSFQVINYFKNAFRLQITWTDNYISSTSNLVKTNVMWSTDSAGYVANRDPLNFSRFNFMAFVTVNEEAGTKEFKDTFFLLDSICKSFCARCFFSDGTWRIMSVNNYEKDFLTLSFFRAYLNNSSVTVDSNGNEILTWPESTNRKVFGGSFGQLPILKEVRAKYSNLTPFDMPLISYNNNSDTSTDFDFTSNEIPIWNGYSYGNVNYTGSNYDFNTGPSDSLIINLGNVAAQTGSGLLINRNFLFQTTQTLDFSDVSGQNDAIFVELALRFRLVSSSGQSHYWPLSDSNNAWTTSDIHPITQTMGPALFWYNFGFGNNYVNVNVQTSELPESGQLFLDAYAKCYYNNYAGIPTGANKIEITENTTTADPTKILVYSQPEVSEEQGIKYTLNSEVISDKFFVAFNSPSGSVISDGVKLELDDNFFGTGPTSAAVGRLETYDFTAGSFDDGTNATWKAFGTGTGVEFTQLQVNQVLKGQMEGRKIFNGSIKSMQNLSPFNYYNTLRITRDSVNTMYAPYQITLNANEDTWSGVWYEANLSTNTQTFESGLITDLGTNLTTNPVDFPNL